MANDTLRIALNSASFPFLYRDAQRATALKGLDQSTPSYYQGVKESFDWNTPQILFCENVMPISKGYISTHTLSTINAYGAGETRFDQAIILRDKNENNTLLVPAGGQNFILSPNAGTWSTTLPFAATGKLITRAFTQGRSFVTYEKEKIFEYDGINNILID